MIRHGIYPTFQQYKGPVDVARVTWAKTVLSADPRLKEIRFDEMPLPDASGISVFMKADYETPGNEKGGKTDEAVLASIEALLSPAGFRILGAVITEHVDSTAEGAVVGGLLAGIVAALAEGGPNRSQKGFILGGLLTGIGLGGLIGNLFRHERIVGYFEWSPDGWKWIVESSDSTSPTPLRQVQGIGG